MKLSNLACKTASAREKPYKLGDGGGLYLLVTQAGNKSWKLKYYFLGKEKKLSLGNYPIISLKEARESRDEAKKLLAKDIDPSLFKQQQKQINMQKYEA